MLTALEVKNAKPQKKPYKLTDGKGLFLHISPSGRKTWRYRYEISGTESTFVLGEYPVLSLEAARAERINLREMVKKGINPSVERKEQVQAQIKKNEIEKLEIENSFISVAHEWFIKQSGRWSEGHTRATMNTLQQNAFPVIGDMAIDHITPPMIMEIIKNIESRGALEIAAKTLQRINSVFRYAVQGGKLTFNPAAEMKGVIERRSVRHYSMIPREDLPKFLQNLTKGDINTITKLAIQFTILTSARSGEVRNATWNEIDLKKKIWTIPADRMKMKIQHVIPLSKQAIAILQRMKILYADTSIIFPGRMEDKPISENTMLYALYRLGYHSTATMHGFRSLFSTVANEAGFNPDAIERQLAHRDKNAIRAAYNRSEYFAERIDMMQWWADYLFRLEHWENLQQDNAANTEDSTF